MWVGLTLSFSTAPSTEASDCVDGDVRLVGGANVTLGRVEVCINNAWGTVCNRRFGAKDAQVICRQLNLPTEGICLRDMYLLTEICTAVLLTKIRIAVLLTEICTAVLLTDISTIFRIISLCTCRSYFLVKSLQEVWFGYWTHLLGAPLMQ